MTTTITPEEIETLRGLADDSGDAATCRWADALADKIEAMQAENTALKQRIEESAMLYKWDASIVELPLLCSATLSFLGGRLRYWLTELSHGGYRVEFIISATGGQCAYWTVSLKENNIRLALDAAEKHAMERGLIRPIDTIVRPEGM